MKKKTKPSKGKIKKLLLPFIPFTSKNLIAAFRVLTNEYPEIVLSPKFNEIAINTKDVDKITDQICNAAYKRIEREDTDAFYKKRKSDSYKGRKRGNVWRVLKEAEDILLLKHMDKWKLLGVNDAEKWVDPCFKLSEAYLKKIPLTDFPIYTGYSTKAVAMMIDEQYALNSVIDALKNEVAKALKNNSEVNKTFLNTVKMIWNNDIDFLLSDSMKIEGEQRGQKISREQINKRNQKIRKIILSGKFKKFTSGKDYLDLKTRLCQMAHHVYILLILSHRWPLEHQKKRLETILRVKTLMREYSIHPVELFDEKDIHQLKGMITSSKGFGVGKLITPTNASQ